MEIWKPIPGFSAYEASNLGNIRRIVPAKRGKTNSLVPYTFSPSMSKDGYPVCKLTSDMGETKTIKVHRLVLLAFVGSPPADKPEGCHNNGVRTDNRLGNLRWDNRAGNMSDMKLHGSHIPCCGSRNGRAKLTESLVNEIRSFYSGKRGQKAELARRYNVSKSTIGGIINGSNW